MTTVVRAALLVAGIALGWYGIATLLDFPDDALMSVALWFGAGILLHDAVFAPLSAALGLGGRHVLPTRWWAPAACGAVCTVTLLALAIPVVGRRNAQSDNPSVLDRPYLLGLLVALLVVWSLVAVAIVSRRSGSSHGHPTETTRGSGTRSEP